MKPKHPKPITGWGILDLESNVLFDRFYYERSHAVLVASEESRCKAVRVVMSVKRGGK